MHLLSGVTESRDVDFRVRTILVLGYWVLGNIHRYWIVSLLGDILCRCDTRYNTEQTAVSTVHMITVLTSAVWPLSADDDIVILIIIVIQF